MASVASAVPGTPVLVGSGFGLTTARELLDAGAAGAIVGSSLKVSTVDSPVDAEKVRALKSVMG